SARIRALSLSVSGTETAPTNLNSEAAIVPGLGDELAFAARGETVRDTGFTSEKTINPAPNRAKKTPGPTLLSLILFPPANENSPPPRSRPPLVAKPRKS